MSVAQDIGWRWYPGYYLSKIINTPQGTDIHDTNDGYAYINPLLLCSDTELSTVGTAVSRDIESKITDYIQQQKDAGVLEDAAVYYRDLLGGPWAIVHGSMMSTPGSLLKVPLALSIYSRFEHTPGFLDKPASYTGEDLNGKEYFKAQDSTTPGVEYPIMTLLKYSLAYSDNNAMQALFDQLTPQEIDESFKDLGIDTSGLYNNNFTLDVRTYASFFRILYNANYLTHADSEEMLSLLAQSTFTQGLVAGLPRGTIVAHKFGEAEFDDGGAQLHDCGIIYKPKAPYLLCVMTHGTDPQKLAPVIADISKIVYDVLKE